MSRKYPRKYWWEMSYFMRAEAGFECERCKDPERPEGGHTLTVNLLIEEMGFYKRANLAVLCRHCQGRVRAKGLVRLAGQLGLFDEGELRWLRPHLEALGISGPEPRLNRN